MNAMIMRSAIREAALEWVDTPYHHEGFVKGKDGGVDCAMILVGVYEPLGLLPRGFDPRPYPMQWHLHRDEERYLNWFTVHAKEVERGKEQVGDVVLFKFGRTVSHSGIIIAPGLMVHAYRQAQRVLIEHIAPFEDRINSYWSVL